MTKSVTRSIENIVADVEYMVKAGEKANAEFIEQVSKSGATYAIGWATQTMVADAKAQEAKRFIFAIMDGMDDSTDEEKAKRIIEVATKMERQYTKEIMGNRHTCNGSMAHNAAEEAIREAKCEMVKQMQWAVESMTGAMEAAA